MIDYKRTCERERDGARVEASNARASNDGRASTSFYQPCWLLKSRRTRAGARRDRRGWRRRRRRDRRWRRRPRRRARRAWRLLH